MKTWSSTKCVPACSYLGAVRPEYAIGNVETVDLLRAGDVTWLAAGARRTHPCGIAATFGCSNYYPLNIYAQPSAPPLARLAELGVARVSYGPWMHRLAMQAVQRALTRIANGENPYPA